MGPSTAAAEAALRALATVRAIRAPRCYDPRHRLYGARRGAWRRRRFEHLWPFANAWSAVASLARVPVLPDVAAGAADVLADFAEGAGRYRRVAAEAAEPRRSGFESSVVPPLGPGGDRYFDDNAWLGLAMVRHADVLGDGEALALAGATFGFVASGWSTDPAARCPGGVRWRDVPGSRARHTCSTAPAIQLALALVSRGGGERLLDWAARAYAWQRTALLRDDGLYADRIATDGTVERTPWSYNQGAMIGAGVLLARATGDPAGLEHAVATAAAARRRYRPDELARQPAAFNAVYFRNLALLDQGPGSPAGWWAEDAAEYVAGRWVQSRDPRTGLFTGRRGSPLNATAPMIEILALLAGAPGGP